MPCISVFCAEPYINITRTDPAFRKNRVIHAIQGQDVTLTCYAENVDPNLSKVGQTYDILCDLKQQSILIVPYEKKKMKVNTAEIALVNCSHL